jgi:hypothetical protein
MTRGIMVTGLTIQAYNEHAQDVEQQDPKRKFNRQMGYGRVALPTAKIQI